ncbi:MAG: type II secretion system protein GspM [Rhizomicrobium sp.]
MTPARQRLIALGILAVVLGLAWLAVVQPIADAFAAQRDGIEQSRRMLAAYEGRIAMRPLVEAKLAQMRSRETGSTGLVGGTSAELAAANIQNVMKTLIESAAGQMRSAQNLAPVTSGGFQRIEIQYDLLLPMTRLKDMVYRIETVTPYLFLDSVDLRAPETWDASGLQLDPPNIDVHWTVRGYRWTGVQ